MNIGEAVNHLKLGDRVARSGWNGKRMWLVLVHGSEWDMPFIKDVSLSVVGPLCESGYGSRASFVAMRAADGALVPWLCSQTDLLASDWELARA